MLIETIEQPLDTPIEFLPRDQFANLVGGGEPPTGPTLVLVGNAVTRAVQTAFYNDALYAAIIGGNIGKVVLSGDNEYLIYAADNLSLLCKTIHYDDAYGGLTLIKIVERFVTGGGTPIGALTLTGDVVTREIQRTFNTDPLYAHIFAGNVGRAEPTGDNLFTLYGTDNLSPLCRAVLYENDQGDLVLINVLSRFL